MKPSPNQNADRRPLKGEPMGTRRRKYMQPSRDHSKGGQNKIIDRVGMPRHAFAPTVWRRTPVATRTSI
jgi:hypothetical protein